MKTIEELKGFYEEALLPDLNILEGKRKKALKLFLATFSVIIAIGIIIFFIILSDSGGRIDYALIPAVIFVALFTAGAYYIITYNYVTSFKEEIIGRLVKFIEPGLEYKKENRIPERLYNKSKLFLRRVDVYEGEDYVSGFVGGTYVEFSELHIQYVSRDGRGRRTYHTVFKGLFFIGDFNKDFSGETFVLPDIAERFLGGVGKFMQSKNISRPPLVKLEDPEFEKYFVVYSTDQVTARYILSTSLMSRILEFRKKAGKQARIAFVDSKVFVAIPYYKNLFEPALFKTLLDFSQIEDYYNDLSLAVGIVEELNLNLRIWTKE